MTDRDSPRDAGALSAWFAELMQATELLVAGETVLSTSLPVRALAVGEMP